MQDLNDLLYFAEVVDRGGFAAAGGGGYQNTEIGQVIVLAYLDAYTKLVDELGGFYQAVADGTYEKYGLKVTVIQGGPQAANRALLIAGKVDFYMGSPLGEMDAVKEGIPLIDVAAIFQKDPQVLLAHPDQGIETFADLAKLDSIFMGKDGYVTYYEWMKKNLEVEKETLAQEFEYSKNTSHVV